MWINLRLLGVMLHYKYTEAEADVIPGKDSISVVVYLSPFLASLGDWTILSIEPGESASL